LLDNPYNLCHTTPALNNSALTTIKKGNNMKNTISALALSLFASAAFAQGIPVSASYEAPVSASAVVADDVSAPTLASDAKDGRRPAPSLSDCCGIPVSATAVASDVSAPSVGAMGCCGVPVSAPQYAKKDEDNSDSLAMAGLGFGLFGLVGLTKFARRKKQK
jgi:hypothetical protein